MHTLNEKMGINKNSALNILALPGSKGVKQPNKIMPKVSVDVSTNRTAKGHRVF